MKYVLKDSLPATQARAQFFGLIDAAYHAGHTTKIVKNGVVVAEVTPVQEQSIDWPAYLKRLKVIKPFLADEEVEDYKKIREDFNKPRFPEW